MPALEQEDQIRVKAQEVLDRLETGITIQSVARTEQAVVSSVRNAMTLVQQQQAVHRMQTDPRYVELLAMADQLLKELGGCRKPVILKRGMAASVQDLLLAAEYIVSEGNDDVVLCERGIRTFETATRNTLDLNAVPYIKAHSHLPVVVDPSHGTGVRELVAPMARAAVACGADGIMVEVHRNPAEAWSDGAQSLYPDQFEALMRGLRPFVEAAGKVLD